MSENQRSLNINTVDQILEATEVVRLEVTDESIIAQVGDILYFDNSWIVLDSIQNKILRFASDGRFLGQISRLGRGPGEFHREICGIASFGNRLAVSDAVNIHLLENYKVVRTIPVLTGHQLSSPGKFALNDQYLYLAAFHTLGAEVPNHAILDYSGKEARTVWGFGKRFELIYNSSNKNFKIHPNSFRVFEHINDQIWVGQPYFSELEIYDLQGRLLAKPSSGVDGMTREDYRGVTTNGEKNATRLRKFTIHNLWHLPPYVIAGFYKIKEYRYSVFDESGSLLAKNLKADRWFLSVFSFPTIRGAVEVTPLEGMTDEKIVASYGLDVLQYLKEIEWKPGAHDEATYLIVSDVKSEYL